MGQIIEIALLIYALRLCPTFEKLFTGIKVHRKGGGCKKRHEIDPRFVLNLTLSSNWLPRDPLCIFSNPRAKTHSAMPPVTSWLAINKAEDLKNQTKKLRLRADWHLMATLPPIEFLAGNFPTLFFLHVVLFWGSKPKFCYLN